MRIFDYPMIWLALGLVVAIASGGWWSSGWLKGFGVALAGAGALLMALASVTMHRHRANLDPTRPPTALVTEGVFRLSRNPIYLGAALLLLGVGLAAASPLALPLAAGFVWLIDRHFIAREEVWLAAAFPDRWAAWSARTRRWL